MPYSRSAAASTRTLETPWWIPFAPPLRALRQFPDSMRPMARRAARSASPVMGNYDALLTWSQWHSVHLAGLELKRRHPEIRWVAHLSDPWVDNPLHHRPWFARRVNDRMEQEVFRNADVIELTSDVTLDAIAQRLPWVRAKAVVVDHAYDPALYSGETPTAGPLIARYIGTFYGDRTPEPLLAALRSLKVGPDIVRVELVGSVPRSMMRTAAWNALPEGLVSVRSGVGYLESLAAMREADVLIVVDAPARRSVFVPSKLIDYIGARRPIVALSPGGRGADIVRALGGWTAPPEDTDAAAAAVHAALQHARSHRGSEWGSEARSRFRIDEIGRLRRRILLGRSPDGACP